MSFTARVARATAQSHSRKGCSRMRAALFAISCATLVGCGSDLASVSGTVTLDNKPLAGSDRLRGTVQFSPQDGRGTTAVGYVDANGRYNLSTGSRVGVPPGKYLVSVSAVEIIPPKIAGEAGSGRLATPPRYANAKSSGLAADVGSGNNTFDFALSSSAK
jgi:hypothetical protein